MDASSLAFVVKIWGDGAAAGPAGRWRGRVDDVEGRSGMAFDSLPALCAYLGEHSGMARGPDAPSGPGDQRRWLADWLPGAPDDHEGLGGPDEGAS